MEGLKCVVVQPDLRSAEPMAWDFVLNFAKDNQLRIVWLEPSAVRRP